MKIFNYLNNFPKMNKRYLNSYKYLIDGDYDVFYGLLDDIRVCIFKNIS